MSRSRWAPRTLRARLTAVLVAVLLAAFAVGGIGVTLLLRHVLAERLDARTVDGVLDRLVTVEVVLFAAVAAMSGVATALVVNRTLRPLRRVAVTAQHMADLPLTAAATQLPDRIAPAEPATEVDLVSQAFDRMLDHVRDALAVRDHTESQLRRFVADASHELRTPLATIRGYSELATRSADPLPASASTAFARINTASTRMGALVDDLLLLARLDAGRSLARRPVDLSQLVLEGVQDARAAAPEHHWHLDLPVDPVEVTGDADRLHQVLANLLANAHVHTPAGTTVSTSVAVIGGHVSLGVCDDGPGISDELRTRVFDRFTRADVARASGRGSSGLGLAIARGIALAHQGALEVSSRAGRTAFTLVLPRTDVSQTSAVAPQTSSE